VADAVVETIITFTTLKDINYRRGLYPVYKTLPVSGAGLSTAVEKLLEIENEELGNLVGFVANVLKHGWSGEGVTSSYLIALFFD